MPQRGGSSQYLEQIFYCFIDTLSAVIRADPSRSSLYLLHGALHRIALACGEHHADVIVVVAKGHGLLPPDSKVLLQKPECVSLVHGGVHEIHPFLTRHAGLHLILPGRDKGALTQTADTSLPVDSHLDDLRVLAQHVLNAPEGIVIAIGDQVDEFLIITLHKTSPGRGGYGLAAAVVGPQHGENPLDMLPLHGRDGDILPLIADMGPVLNGQPCPMYQAVAVKAGDQLRLGAAKTGCHSYLAFAGGLDVPQVMGSRATALQNQVGGYQGRKLAKGDQVGFRAPNTALAAPRIAPVPAPAGKEVTIRVILGPQDDMFTKEGINAFLSQPYTVSKDFDRMGCRLEGAVIQHKTDGNIISDGMVTGAIQVPTSGQPIIMLAERQTVGGYTKIATVISADLPLVGQRKTGDVIRFQAVTVEEAHRLWREFTQELEDLKGQLDRPQTVQSQPAQSQAAQPVGITYKVTVNGRTHQVQVVKHS